MNLLIPLLLLQDITNLLLYFFLVVKLLLVQLLLHLEQLRIVPNQLVQLRMPKPLHQLSQALEYLLTAAAVEGEVNLILSEQLYCSTLPLHLLHTLHEVLPILHTSPPLLVHQRLALVHMGLMDTLLTLHPLPLTVEELLNVLSLMTIVQVLVALQTA